MGVNVQAVKSRLHRARLSVRKRVAPLLGVDLSRPAVDVGACPDVLTLFSQHLEDEISADVCTEMERHQEKCGRCQGACDSLKRTVALCRNSAAAMEVPRSVQSSVRTALRSCLAEKG